MTVFYSRYKYTEETEGYSFVAVKQSIQSLHHSKVVRPLILEIHTYTLLVTNASLAFDISQCN